MILQNYKENPTFKTIALNMISQISSYQIEKNEKFNVCTKSMANAIINPLKISYIKKDKIESLAKHANITIHNTPTPEQRNKYFSACTLRKFANHYFNTEGISAAQLEQFDYLVSEATAAANLLMPKQLHILDAEHIPQIYNYKYNNHDNNEPFNINKLQSLFIAEKSDINASCMQGKDKDFFELYTDIDESANTLKMAILTQGNEIVARSLIWIDKPAADIDRRKKQNPRHFYIDRIYTKTQDHRTETQTQLYSDLIKYFNIELKADYFNCDEDELNNGTPDTLRLPPAFNRDNMQDGYISKVIVNTGKIKNFRFPALPAFDVELNSDSYEYYPYADTFQTFNTYNETLSSDSESGSEILELKNIDGSVQENTHECEQCGSEGHTEDELTYINTADVSACEDCRVYCEDREENILEDDSIYNSNTDIYHYRPDLSI